jgi:hypothetical protein
MRRYMDEFCFRYGGRENPDVFDRALRQGVAPEADGAWRVKAE